MNKQLRDTFYNLNCSHCGKQVIKRVKIESPSCEKCKMRNSNLKNRISLTRKRECAIIE